MEIETSTATSIQNVISLEAYKEHMFLVATEEEDTFKTDESANYLGKTYTDSKPYLFEDLANYKQKHKGTDKEFKKKGWKCDIY